MPERRQHDHERHAAARIARRDNFWVINVRGSQSFQAGRSAWAREAKDRVAGTGRSWGEVAVSMK
jgi:hypothetical protein